MPTMGSRLTNPIEVFCAYNEHDDALREQLAKHLSLMKTQGLINILYNHRLSPGTEMLVVIKEHLERARIILLLVSPDFMASEYSTSIELTHAIERDSSKKARVIPILLR